MECDICQHVVDWEYDSYWDGEVSWIVRTCKGCGAVVKEVADYVDEYGYY